MAATAASTNTFKTFFQEVLQLFYGYLDEQIDSGDLLLYTLCRYQRECRWFQRKALADLAESADSRHLEAVLDNHLRDWLFREGIDYPFSKPRSPSGEPDIVVWHGEKPLPLEVKVFDGVNRDASHVSQGLWQAARYALDYGHPFGYLVVFNTTENSLLFESAGMSTPPSVPVADRHVFVVTVAASVRKATASKEKPTSTVTIQAPVDA